MAGGHDVSEARAPGDLRDALRLGALIGAWIAGPLLLVRTFVVYASYGDVGEDAHAYWLTAHDSHLYGAAPGTVDAFLYSPAFAQLVRPLAVLPFPWFTAVLIALDVAAFAWLLWPLGWRWGVPIMCLLAPEFVLGQVTGVLTVAAVLAVTVNAGWWAVGWLTKITPGMLGSVWCVARRDWLGLLEATAWAAALAGASYVLWPGAWVAWWDFLSSAPGSGLVAVRLVGALVLVAVGGRRGWWWVVPVALMISAPTLGLQIVGYLCGLVRLRQLERRSQVDSTAGRAVHSSV